MVKKIKSQIAQRQSKTFDDLRSISIFSNLSDSEIAPFQKVVHIRPYKKDKLIYMQGEPAKFFYVIGGGWIKLFRTMPEGEEVIVDMLTTGHTFGESAIFDHDYHMCSAQVVEDVQLLSIPSEVLREQIRVIPTLAINMLSTMSRHHRHHYSELAFNAMLSAPQRIGCFLLRLCHGNKKESIVVRLPYDKSLIAKTLGMKNATFSRGINILRQKTGIRLAESRVEIDLPENLVKFVYGAVPAKDEADEI